MEKKTENNNNTEIVVSKINLVNNNDNVHALEKSINILSDKYNKLKQIDYSIESNLKQSNKPESNTNGNQNNTKVSNNAVYSNEFSRKSPQTDKLNKKPKITKYDNLIQCRAFEITYLCVNPKLELISKQIPNSAIKELQYREKERIKHQKNVYNKMNFFVKSTKYGARSKEKRVKTKNNLLMDEKPKSIFASSVNEQYYLDSLKLNKNDLENSDDSDKVSKQTFIKKNYIERKSYLLSEGINGKNNTNIPKIIKPNTKSVHTNATTFEFLCCKANNNN